MVECFIFACGGYSLCPQGQSLYSDVARRESRLASRNDRAGRSGRDARASRVRVALVGAGEANRKVADPAEVAREAAEAGGLARAGEESPSREARAREAARARNRKHERCPVEMTAAESAKCVVTVSVSFVLGPAVYTTDKDPKDSKQISVAVADRSPGQGAEGQNRVEALGVLLLLRFQRVPPAKPSELRVEPAELSYKAIGGLKGVSVVNDTQERKFFKVKCSDNMLYRVNPVFGAVEPGKSARIDILRQNGGAKIDKIVLVTTKAEEGEIPCREVFNQGRSTEMMVLPLLVQE
ncbi:hypothetical protein Aduo_010871 [Ancylostoma duodenale]